MNTAIQKFSTKQEMTADRFECYHYKDLSFGRLTPHTHTHYEMYFFLDGNTKYTVDNMQYQLRKGDFLLIPPNLLHFPEVRFGTEKGAYERFVVWLRPEYLLQLPKETALSELLPALHDSGTYHFRPDAEQMQKIFYLLGEIAEEQAESNYGSEFASELLLLQLLVTVNRILHKKREVQKTDPKLDLYSEIVRYIHKYPKNPLSLDELSAAFYVSKSYIAKLFRQHLNLSVHEYVLRVKLDRVLSEIDSGASVTDASADYGFLNYSTFYRQCKKIFGVSPKELYDSVPPAGSEESGAVAVKGKE